MMASRNTTVQEPADARRASAVRQPAAEDQTKSDRSHVVL